VCLLEAHALHPGSPVVECARGALEAAKGNTDAANRHFQRALSADPTNGHCLVASAKLLRQQVIIALHTS